MAGIDLYRDSGLEIYENVHYSRGEHIREVEAILSWYHGSGGRILDIGCSGGLHALELAKRGYRVTGIDVEMSAVVLARARCAELNLAADFFVADLENYDLSALGKFHLACSLGNVISHIPKNAIPAVFRKIRHCLDASGIFLFDALIIGDPFPEQVHEKELGIIWKRKLDRNTGEIHLTGIFTDFGVTQDFLVWGHAREDLPAVLTESGFSRIDVSDSLNFSRKVTVAENPVCLKYRAWAGEA